MSDEPKPQPPPKPIPRSIISSKEAYLETVHDQLELAQLRGISADIRHYLGVIGKLQGWTEDEAPEPAGDPAADREAVIRMAKRLGIKPEELK
jgi:hypothetical protein